MLDSVNVGPLYTVVSRKVRLVSLTSKVNLIVSWVSLAFFMNSVSSDCEPVHMMKMSSMNLFHTNILSVRACIFSSILPINRFAYAGAILVPIAVPCICR